MAQKSVDWSNVPDPIGFPDQFAALVGRSRATVYRWLQESRGPKVVTVGNFRVVRRDAFNEWVRRFEQ